LANKRRHITIYHCNAARRYGTVAHFWIRNYCLIATRLGLVLLVLVVTTSSKTPKAPSFQMRYGMKFWQDCSSGNLCIDWRSRIFDLTSHFQDGGHDIVSRGKVLSPVECTRSVYPAHMQQRPPISDL